MSDDRHPSEPCPKCGNPHEGDCLADLIQAIDERVIRTLWSASLVAPAASPVLTYEMLQAEFDEIKYGPLPTVNDVLNEGLAPDMTPAFLPPFVQELITPPPWPTPLQDVVKEYAMERLRRQVADRPTRIVDLGVS